MQATNDTVRCWSGGGPQNKVWNWGDAISPEIYRLVAGASPQVVDYTDLTDAPHIMICGSTLKWATAGSVLWGVGEIAENMRFVQGSVRPLHVAAVRGPLTRQRLQEAGIACPELYCDPALVFPTFYTPPPTPRRYRLGIIPHYVDATDPALARFRDLDDVCLIDITQTGVDEGRRIRSVIDAVCACDAIVSSSLHGLILADAYGIPARWMRLSDKIFGGGFKFRDYFLSVDQAVRADEPLADLSSVEALADAAAADFVRHGRVRPDISGFLAAFPGPAKSAPLTDVARWTTVAGQPPPWDARNRIIAARIPEDSTVIDFGAGNQSLRRLTTIHSYVPVDCVQSTADVFLCDYNREHRFPDVRPDLLILSGFLEYIVDVEGFLAALKRVYPGTRCVFSWAFEPHDAAARRANGWIADINPVSEADAPFAAYLTALEVVGMHRTPRSRQAIYEGFL